MVCRKRPLRDRGGSSQGVPPVTVYENTGHGVQSCQAVHDDSASRNTGVNAHHKGCATKEKSVCDGSVASRTRSSVRKKPRHVSKYGGDKHVINEKPEETKHLVNTTSVLSAKDEMAGVKIDVNHEVNGKPEGTKQIMQTEEKFVSDGSVASRTRTSARKRPRHASKYGGDKHVINEKPEETKHLVDTTSVLSVKDEMAGVKIDVNHVVNENPEGTKQIVQTDSKKRIKKRTKKKKRGHGVESMTKEMTDISPQKLPVSSLPESSLDHESVVSVARVADNLSTSVPGVNVDTSHELNKKSKEKKHILNTATVLPEKKEMDGMTGDLSQEVNEKPDDRMRTVEGYSKKRRKREARSSKRVVESMNVTDNIRTSILKTNVNGFVLANDHLVDSDLTSACDKYHISPANPTVAVVEKEEITGVDVDLSDNVNEKPEETNHIVETCSKKGKRKPRSKASKCAVVEKDEITGVDVDLSDNVNEKPIETNHIVETGSNKRKRKPRCKASECAVKSTQEEVMDKYNISPANRTVAVVEKEEIAGVDVDRKHSVNEKPEETKHIVETGSNKRKRKSRCKSTQEEVIDKYHISPANPTVAVVEKEEIAGVNVDLSHNVNEKPEERKHMVETSSKKRKRKPQCQDSKCAVKSTQEEVMDKYHISPANPTVAVVEKEEIAGVNIDLSHNVDEKPEETKHIVETRSKKREKKRRSKASKCAVKLTQEEVVDTSSQRLPICCMGETSLDHQSAASVSVATDNMSTVEPKVEVIRTVLANEHPVEEEGKRNVTMKDQNTVESMLAVTEETKDTLKTTSSVLEKDNMAGVTIDLNLEVNEKPKETKHIVKKRKKKPCSISSKCVVKSTHEEVTDTSSQRLPIDYMGRTLKSRRKLLVLDVNGLLVDVVAIYPARFKPDFILARKGVFKRPFCDDFLRFCFKNFDVGIWSSRTMQNLTTAVDFLMKNTKNKLLFCWHQSHCTNTGYKTIENRDKPLVLKELKKLWENKNNDLPWQKGFYNESNTILLDDSPYKALRNPPYTAIYPLPYSFQDAEDKALGPDGDIRLYLERLADAENVQQFIQANPFGQRPITEAHSSWNFYSKIAGAHINRHDKGIARTYRGLYPP
ncbi:hypothetical protein RND81_02G038300 [Saponaria officinalis]|uniref:FCP1 homology domain-containing protein n=1 Tax=Saponaria officinalis TaxID=3572 RepID=A0AAW1MR25_SAPOF